MNLKDCQSRALRIVTDIIGSTGKVSSFPARTYPIGLAVIPPQEFVCLHIEVGDVFHDKDFTCDDNLDEAIRNWIKDF